MLNYLEEYKAYYKARAKRYAGNPNFPFTAVAEKNLCDAMLACNDLGEFKTRLGNLNELCAVALTKDSYTLRLKHYKEIEEKIRALGPERIMAKADNFSNSADLITMVNEEENKNSIEIAMDHISPFDGDWFLLERLEIYERAEVPEKWKSKMAESAEDIRKSLRNNFTTTTSDMQKWQAGWKLNLELINETRHRRQIPFPDSEVKMRVDQYQNIVK
jgi:hypothetical protein